MVSTATFPFKSIMNVSLRSDKFSEMLDVFCCVGDDCNNKNNNKTEICIALVSNSLLTGAVHMIKMYYIYST